MSNLGSKYTLINVYTRSLYFIFVINVYNNQCVFVGRKINKISASCVLPMGTHGPHQLTLGVYEYCFGPIYGTKSTSFVHVLFFFDFARFYKYSMIKGPIRIRHFFPGFQKKGDV